MEPKSFSDLTKEQQEQFKKAFKSYVKKSLLAGASAAITLILLDLVIVLLNGVYVQSDKFQLYGTVGAALAVLSGLVKSSETRKYAFLDEVDKIMKPKEEDGKTEI